MQSRQRILKIYMKDIFVQYALFYQMIQLFVRIVIWLSCVEVAKMIGKDKEMENLNVQTANLQNSPEI